jgi:hypothetical protein
MQELREAPTCRARASGRNSADSSHDSEKHQHEIKNHAAAVSPTQRDAFVAKTHHPINVVVIEKRRPALPKADTKTVS